MELVIRICAVYGVLRIVLDIIGVFHLKNLRRQYAQEEEEEQRKMDAFRQRHGRIRELLARKYKLLERGIFVGPEVEAINIELLTLLDEALAEEGPDDFYQSWRDEIIKQYVGRQDA